MILQLNKPVGKTPLDMIKEYKAKHPDQKDVPMTYAGRLDPMAEGLLLVLTGDDVHRKDEFLGLDKTYEAQILLGASTDTGDILGLVQKTKKVSKPSDFDSLFLVGSHHLNLPPYSAYKVDGKPLWQYARDGQAVPLIKKEMIVHSADFIGGDYISKKEIIERINKVEGDFRQDNIISSWSALAEDNFFVLNLSFNVSAGTYIRCLATLVGDHLDMPTTLFSLFRTKVGKFHLK